MNKFEIKENQENFVIKEKKPNSNIGFKRYQQSKTQNDEWTTL